jgi:hypothetical protein
MIKCILKTQMSIAVFIIGLFLTIQKIEAQQNIKVLKAVFSYPPVTYQPNDSNLCNSDPSFVLYKKLGYNAFIECIHAPSPGSWIKPEYVVKPDVRMTLVNNIREKKKRLEKIGISYCPFFSEWGWGGELSQIDDRARAVVYREVPIIENYYGRDVYPQLTKTTSGWGDTSIKCIWDQNIRTCKIVYNGPSNGCARVSMSTRILKRQFQNLLPQHLINGQCYDISYRLNLSSAKLIKGDYFRLYCFREYASGFKPDPIKLPLGEIENPNVDSREFLVKNYEVTSVLPDGYIFNQAFSAKPYVTIHERIWIDSAAVCGNGMHMFDSLVRLDFELSTSNKSHGAATYIENIQIQPVDPLTIVCDRKWETSAAYSEMLKKYPREKLRETRADYDFEGTLVQKRLFLDSVHEGKKIKKVYGHFEPFNNDHGWGSLVQNTVDPLSPVTDLVTMEMLRIIRDGLDSVEPPCYYISSDEVPVFRRDYLTMKSGIAGTIYNKATNGEYFGTIINEQIKRYRKVFQVHDVNPRKAAFVICGDMVLPFGIGYKCFAEKQGDQDALAYLNKHRDGERIAVAIWEYDYASIPKCLPCVPKEFSLTNKSFINENIQRVRNNNLEYIAWYASDGRMSDLMTIDPSINNDKKHIQHEIDMARSWCDVVTTNNDCFFGYMYCGWSVPFKSNQWNGLFPLAYFGWKNIEARDFPGEWKKISTESRGDNDQPVLDLLQNGVVPW